MLKISLTLITLILTGVLTNLTYPCFAHRQQIQDDILSSTSKRDNLSKIVKVDDCKIKLGNGHIAR